MNNKLSITSPSLVIALIGDSGDGIQLMGTQLTKAATSENIDVNTLPTFPAEIRAPGLVGGDLRGEFQPGWTYAVEVTPNLRICCDNGDNACSSIPWEQPVNEAKLSPAIERPLETTTTKRELEFSLSSAEIADNVVLDPDAVTEAPFLIKAAKVQDGNAATPVDGAAVSCRLDTREKKLAEGTLQLQPGTDRSGQVNRISSGTVKLSYQAPKE